MKRTKVVLGDVAKIIRGITFKPSDLTSSESEDAVACLRTKNIQVQLDASDLIWVPAKFVKRSDQYVRGGDILVSSANSWNLVGKCCWIENLSYKATAGGFISILRGKEEKIFPRYLYHWFSSQNTQTLVRSFGRQTTNISNLDINRCLEIPLILPPISEQRRITAILDKADSLRDKRQQMVNKHDEFLQSVFIDMFGDPVTNPKGLEKRPIKDFGKVVTGNTPPRSNSDYYGASIEWIKSDNINTPFHILTIAEEWLSATGRSVGRVVPRGSVLVTCIAGSPSCIGNAALTDRDVAFNQQINAIVPNAHTNSYFLYTQILLAKRLIQATSTNSMKGMVSKSTFEEIELLFPTKQEQDKFGLWFERIDATASELRKALILQEKMFQSLQQRAFTGELFSEESATSTQPLLEVAQHV